MEDKPTSNGTIELLRAAELLLEAVVMDLRMITMDTVQLVDAPVSIQLYAADFRQATTQQKSQQMSEEPLLELMMNINAPIT